MTYLLAARALLARVPWQVWAILGLLAVWAWDRDRHADKREAEVRAEMQVALEAALESEEQALRQLAKRTDRNVEQARADNRDRTERFIAAGGVRQACPADRNATDRSAGNSAPMHQAPVMDGTERLPEVVTVLPDDVRICTDNTLTAEALRAFVLALENQAGE